PSRVVAPRGMAGHREHGHSSVHAEGPHRSRGDSRGVPARPRRLLRGYYLADGRSSLTERTESARASQGFVDYEQVAERYEEGRALPSEVLDRWGDEVRPYL